MLGRPPTFLRAVAFPQSPMPVLTPGAPLWGRAPPPPGPPPTWVQWWASGPEPPELLLPEAAARCFSDFRTGQSGIEKPRAISQALPLSKQTHSFF